MAERQAPLGITAEGAEKARRTQRGSLPLRALRILYVLCGYI